MGNKLDTAITVTVDTEKINSGNINQCVVISDNRNDTPQPINDPKDFVSIVDKNMKAIWEGLSKNGKDIVEITDVIRKDFDDNPKILKESTNSSTTGIVEAKIKDKYVKGDESYNINFTIKGKNSYQVDPKLRMSTEE